MSIDWAKVRKVTLVVVGLVEAIAAAILAFLSTGCATTGNASWDAQIQFVERQQIESQRQSEAEPHQIELNDVLTITE